MRPTLGPLSHASRQYPSGDSLSDGGKGYKLAVFSGRAVAHLEGAIVPISRFSPEEVELAAEVPARAGRAILRFGEEAIGPLRLEPPFAGRQEDDDSPLNGASWGRGRTSAFALRDLSLEHARQLVRVGLRLGRGGDLAPSSAPIPDARPVPPEEAPALAELIAANRCSGVLRTLSGRTLPVTAIGLAADPLSLVWDCEEVGKARAPFVLEVSGEQFLYRIDVNEAWAYEGTLSTPIDALQMFRLRRRAYRRAGTHAGHRVSLLHPLWAELRIERALRDCSWDGLALCADPAEDVLYPGLAIDGVRVDDGSPEGITLHAVVRALVPDAIDPATGERSAVCGMHVTPASPGDETRWLDFVMTGLHTATRSGDGYSEQTWELFERAGYFHLSDKEPQEFLTQKESFVRVSEKLSSAPRVGAQIVWPSERGLEASMSMIKPFSSAWFLHHMAKRRDGGPSCPPGRQILRDVYFGAYELVQTDPELRWLAGYAEAHVRWSRLAHFDFADRFVARDEACNYPFRLLEAGVESAGEPRPMGVEFGPPTFLETETLLTTLARTRPRAYLDALDLVPGRFDLAPVTCAWADAGLSRERAVLVARRRGRAELAMILETAEDGTNLFHVLDGVRLIPLVPDPLDDVAPFLLDVARAWYRARGKEAFVHYQEDGPGLDLARCHLRDLGEGVVWALSSVHLPAFLEHIYRVTSPKSDPREVRKEPPSSGIDLLQRRADHGASDQARVAQESRGGSVASTRGADDDGERWERSPRERRRPAGPPRDLREGGRR